MFSEDELVKGDERFDRERIEKLVFTEEDKKLRDTLVNNIKSDMEICSSLLIPKGDKKDV